ncbi:MAG: energy transducer TonB family protein [Pseudomonadota bacterium]
MTKTRSFIASMLFAVASAAFAQTPEPSLPPPARTTPAESSPGEASPAAVPPTIEVRTLAFRPSMQPLFRAVAASARARAGAEVEVDYDASGTVTAIRMIRSSGSRALDGAVVDWARRMRLQPGAAGTGRLPFDFTLD